MKNIKFSPALAFIIGFCTLGLGNNANIYIISDKIGFDKQGRVICPMMEMMLNIITFGIYGIFWTYKISSVISAKNGSSGVTSETVLNTVLSALPTRCISMALVVKDLDFGERF